MSSQGVFEGKILCTILLHAYSTYKFFQKLGIANNLKTIITKQNKVKNDFDFNIVLYYFNENY